MLQSGHMMCLDDALAAIAAERGRTRNTWPTLPSSGLRRERGNTCEASVPFSTCEVYSAQLGQVFVQITLGPTNPQMVLLFGHLAELYYAQARYEQVEILY